MTASLHQRTDGLISAEILIMVRGRAQIDAMAPMMTIGERCHEQQ
jgi:hypothetical protein